MVTKEQLTKLQQWHYINTNVDSFPISGWKIHVFGDTLDDSVKVGNTLEPILKKFGITMKIATNILIKTAIGIPSHNQYGKVATIYLGAKIFSEEKISDFVDCLQKALSESGYTKSGKIHGDKSIDGILHYRYELKEYVDPKIGVSSHHRYMALYEGNRGNFNIPDNPDIEYLLRGTKQ